MKPSSANVRERAELYAQKRKLTIRNQLGGGYDGLVLGTLQRTAIKVLNAENLFWRELSVYQRLKKHNVSIVAGFDVPRLVSHDDTLWIVEMTIVSPPFVLDFATAGLDEPLKMSQEEQDAWEDNLREKFEGDFKKVRLVYFALQRYGIHLYDLHPRNVCCR